MLRFLVVVVLVASALAAPEGNKTEKTEEVATKKEERAVVVSDSTWESIMSSPMGTMALYGLGGILVLSGIGAAGYHFYYSKYVLAATDPYTAYNYPYSYQYPYQTVARSLDTASNWNWNQVLDMIRLAQEQYEKFDWQSIDCQKKAICELSKEQAEFGETGRKISSTFSFVDVLEGLPMPKLIMEYLKEMKGAITQARSSSKSCNDTYPKCSFSVKEVIVKIQKRSNSL